MMNLLRRGYDGLITGLAYMAAVIVALTFAAIVIDVIIRELGVQPPEFTSALSEYAMLVVTMAAAPWLVREKGHVAVESLNMVLDDRSRLYLGKLVYLSCVILSLIIAYYGAKLAFQTAGRGEMDIRSIVMPRWFLFAVLAGGFLLCAVEFARYLFSQRSMYSGRGINTDGL